MGESEGREYWKFGEWIETIDKAAEIALSPNAGRQIHHRINDDLVSGICCSRAQYKDLLRGGFYCPGPDRIVICREEIDPTLEPLPADGRIFLSSLKVDGKPMPTVVVVQKQKGPVRGYLCDPAKETAIIGFYTLDGSIAYKSDVIQREKTGAIVRARRADIRMEREIKKAGFESSAPLFGAVGAQLWNDRKHQWSVRADLLLTTVTLGVYPEEVKSLFCARDLPLTSSGRRASLLHWVSAHKRRIDAGIDVDVKKHLRGSEAFRMGGVTYRIVEPKKAKGA